MQCILAASCSVLRLGSRYKQ